MVRITFPIGGGEVHLFGDRDEADLEGLEQFEGFEGDDHGAREAVELVDDDGVEGARLGVGEHRRELRARPGVVAPGGLAFVGVDRYEFPPVRFAVEADRALLRRQAVVLGLLVGTDPNVAGDADNRSGVSRRFADDDVATRGTG